MRARSLPIMAACLLAGLAVSRGDDSRHSTPLQAVATTDATEVHPDSVFEVTLSIENHTDSAQSIKIPYAGWDRMWKSSNHHVTWDEWDSDENDETTVQIPPHKSYIFPKALRMFVDDATKPGRLDFRMGFKTKAFGKTLWSSPITLDVTP